MNNEDLKKGILAQYIYRATDNYGFIALTLFKSGKYFYKLESFGANRFSEGKWSKSGSEIILTSDIRKNDLPVKLIYLNDTSDKSKYPIKIVKNLNDELLVYAFVFINN